MYLTVEIHEAGMLLGYCIYLVGRSYLLYMQIISLARKSINS